MKRILSVMIALALSALLLAACGSNNSSSVPASQPVASASAPAVSAPSTPASEAASEVTPEGPYSVDDLLAAIAPAAGIDGGIELTARDITGGDTAPIENFAAFAGAQSPTYAQQGGMVAVIQAKPGTVEDVKATVEAYLDSVLAQGEAYKTDYPVAYENVQNARVVVNGDYVVFAVAGTDPAAGYTVLDATIAAAFA